MYLHLIPCSGSSASSDCRRTGCQTQSPCCQNTAPKLCRRTGCQTQSPCCQSSCLPCHGYQFRRGSCRGHRVRTCTEGLSVTRVGLAVVHAQAQGPRSLPCGAGGSWFPLLLQAKALRPTSCHLPVDASTSTPSSNRHSTSTPSSNASAIHHRAHGAYSCKCSNSSWHAASPSQSAI